MRQLAIVLKLAPVDLKNVRRDSLLVWIPVLPFVIALALRWGIPALTEALRNHAGLDLAPWYPLIMSTFVVAVSGTVGTVSGFLLLDERDDGVLDALMVTPLSSGALIAYRVATPLALGFVLTLISYPIVGLTPMSLIDLVTATALGAFAGPFTALFLAAFADNKVSGFAMVKLFNNLQILPVVAYFIDPPLQLVFALMPTYWPMKIFWLAAEGEPYAGYLLVGFLVNLAAVGLLLWKFDRVAHR